MSERRHSRTCERMAADSTSVTTGLQPGGGGTPDLRWPPRRLCPCGCGAEQGMFPGRYPPNHDYNQLDFAGWFHTPFLHPPGWLEHVVEQERDTRVLVASQDGQVLGVASPCVPPRFQLTGEYFWQAAMGDGRWRDVDPNWNDVLFHGLASGLEQMSLVHTWEIGPDGRDPRHSQRTVTMHDWYTIDFTGPECVYQEHQRTGVRRPLRALQWVLPTGMYPPPERVGRLYPEPEERTPAHLAPVSVERLEAPGENVTWL